MASQLADPTRVQIRAEISFHEALDAVCEFVSRYPAERLAPLQAERLRQAANQIDEKIAEHTGKASPDPGH